VAGAGAALSTVYAGARPASAARTRLLGTTFPLAPVGLQDVLAHAELQSRTDRKYVMLLDVLPALIARLGPRFRVLEIDGRRMFGYQSIYFDTPDLLSYRQHLQNNRRRFKVRTRTYVDSGECMLEVKVQGSRSATVKHRRPHPVDGRFHLDGEACRFIAWHTGAAHVPARLRPVLVTSYRRLTLVDLAGGVRITCDADLVCRSGDRWIEGLHDRLLIETKSAGPQRALTHVFHDLGLRSTALSKYCLGLAMLADNLRANPWQRQMRRHFGGVTADRR
jgi:hypothetical protein